MMAAELADDHDHHGEWPDITENTQCRGNAGLMLASVAWHSSE